MNCGRVADAVFAKKAVLWAVAAVSGFFRALGWRACRFYPTCSEYARQAYDARPFWGATGLMLKRLLRCHPFCAGGYDPVSNQKE